MLPMVEPSQKPSAPMLTAYTSTRDTGRPIAWKLITLVTAVANCLPQPLRTPPRTAYISTTTITIYFTYLVTPGS